MSTRKKRIVSWLIALGGIFFFIFLVVHGYIQSRPVELSPSSIEPVRQNFVMKTMLLLNSVPNVIEKINTRVSQGFTVNEAVTQVAIENNIIENKQRLLKKGFLKIVQQDGDNRVVMIDAYGNAYVLYFKNQEVTFTLTEDNMEITLPEKSNSPVVPVVPAEKSVCGEKQGKPDDEEKKSGGNVGNQPADRLKK